MDNNDLMEFFSVTALADCLASMRARLCVKRHPNASLDRFFKGIKPSAKIGKAKSLELELEKCMPPRRLWSRPRLEARKCIDKSCLNKQAIMRHVRWVISSEKLGDYEWGRCFAEFVGRIRARVSVGDFDFEAPTCFAIGKNGGKARFVSSFEHLADKVILRQVVKYLSAKLDSKISTNCYSFRKDSKIDHTTAVRALIDYRGRHKGETLWVAECDIQKFFDVVDHEVAWEAFNRVSKGVEIDPLARKAVRKYLDVYTSLETLLEGVKDDASRSSCEAYVGKIRNALKDIGREQRDLDAGLPQGGVLSGLIANWVMDWADRRVLRGGDADLFYARFCDDIVIVHPDKKKCRAARDRYLRALRRLLLPYHRVRCRIPYGPEFYNVKSKGPYCWREPAREHERGVSPWVSFLGNQVGFDGGVRVRRDSINRHIASLKDVQRKFLGVLYAAKRDGSGITMRKGTKSHPVTRSAAIQSMMKTIVSKGVGYLRSGPFAAGDMCWMSAFTDIHGGRCVEQLKQLDAIRADILYPLQKKAGAKLYFGHFASYHGFLEREERPHIGGGQRRHYTRIGYSEI